jgi:hypothetical protein
MTHNAEIDAPEHVAGRCFAANGDVPCQKGAGHGGGHWFMTDDMFACLDAGHYDPTNVLSLTPLVHLDVPCPRRVIPPGETEERSS